MSSTGSDARFGWGLRSRAVHRAASVEDLRLLARRHTPRAVFDYTDGSAGTEISLARQREAFQRVEFTPRALTDVTRVDPSTTFLGRRVDMPIGFAPTGFTRLMQHEGEIATARVAAANDIPFVLSTLGTTDPEELHSHVPAGNNWFQLYISRDRTWTENLIDRIGNIGMSTIVLTIDTPVGGLRRRDIRNGLTIPPRPTVRTIFGMARHPRWWWHAVTGPPLKFASLRDSEGTVGELLTRVFDPSLTLTDVAWLRQRWAGTLVVKGVQSVETATQLREAGVDAIVLSNHGGRQLDRAPVPLELLPHVVKAVGEDMEVYLDGGVMDGADALAAVAWGARGVFVGRAHLYALMAGGSHGVDKLCSILREQVVTQMALLGAATLADLSPDHVRLRPTPNQ